MEKTFANLLRHSKIVTYDRRLSQVYTTPKQFKQQGDWGLKRNLPSVIRTPYVTIGQLDSLEHQTPWTSGESEVLFIERWKENFQGYITPKQQQHNNNNSNSGGDYNNLANMSKREFQHFLTTAITPEVVENLHNALKTKKITREQVYDYLNITFRPEPHRIKGPIYSTKSMMDKNNDDGIIVPGRILNVLKSGYAVGIGGVVAFLPKSLAVGLRKSGNRHNVHKFNVKEAYIDDQGKPHVILSLYHPPTTTSSSPSSSTSSITKKDHLSLSLPSITSPTSSLPRSPLLNNNNDINNDKSSHPWSSFSLDELFSPVPFNNINDLHSFLIDQDLRRLKRRRSTNYINNNNNHQFNTNNTNKNNHKNNSHHHNNNNNKSPLSTSAFMDDQQHHKSSDELLEDHSVLMNRIINLLKNGPVKK